MQRLLLKDGTIRTAELVENDILVEKVWEDEKGFIFECDVQKICPFREPDKQVD